MTITDIISILKKTDDVIFREGASDELISNVELALNIQFPDDFKQFYKFSNGIEIGHYLFNIIRLEEIVENKLERGYPEFYIAEYMIYSDMWELEINPANNNEYKIFYMNQLTTSIVLTTSLAEFLSRLLKKDVVELYEWADKIQFKN